MATLPLNGWDFTLPADLDATADADAGGDTPAVPLDGAAYLDLLTKHAPSRVEWHSEAAEHMFTYVDAAGARHAVYYPSLKGLAERLGMLRGLGVGVALS